MALQIVVNKLKKLLLVFFGLVKRSLCCFKRRRRSSCESIPLTGVGVAPPYQAQNDVESWAWEETGHAMTDPNSIQHHIEMYRQQSARGQSEEEEEPQTNFFEDMTPKITKQTKLHLRPQNYEQESHQSSRLSFAPESIPVPGSELGSWEESEGQGSWEEAESWDAARLVREKRRAEREKQSASKRDQNRASLGSKVS